MKVIVVGGVAGGASAAARLRRLDENAEIIILERGGYVSYANCGLPYYVGDTIKEESKLTLQTPESFRSRFNIDVRVKNEAVKISTADKKVLIRDLNTGKEYEETYDKLILSPGAKPVCPPLDGIDDRRIFTLRSVEDSFVLKNYIKEHTPKNAVVVGGGFIGLEMAENLTEAGAAVHLIEKLPQVMAPLDYDMSCEVAGVLKAHGIKLHLGTGVTGFADHGASLTVHLDNENQIDTELVILAIGVAPDTAVAKAEGIELGMKNSILVNDKMETSVPDIYAAGDAVMVKHYVSGKDSLIALAGPANKQGRIIADNICGLDSHFGGSQGSSILKLFDKTIASTGLNERLCKEAGIDCDVVVSTAASHAGYYPGGENMTVKVVFAPQTGRILGAQIVGGQGADKRIDVLATAIHAGMTGADLEELDLAYAPPYSSAKDPVNMSGFMIENVRSGRVKQWHWTDVARLQKDKDVILLDVRKDEEYAAGHIGCTRHIPVDELRDRLDELDISKPIYVNCQSGLRSYIACRILSQKGFNCYNFSGGYRFFHIVSTATAPDAAAVYDCGIRVDAVASGSPEQKKGGERIGTAQTIAAAEIGNAQSVSAKGTPVAGTSISAENIKRVKGLGFLHCKGTDNFNARIITRNGKITNAEMACITEAANRFGNGEVAMTTRLTVEVQQIPFENIDAFIEFVGKAGLLTGGTGSKVRPVVSCKGTTCQYGLIDAFALSDTIHERFYIGYHGVDLPHKFKIAIGGCPNNCVKPNLNDLGIIGQKVPVINEELCHGCKKCAVMDACPIKSAEVVDGKITCGENCNHCGRCVGKCPFGAVTAETSGYKVCIGGRWGKKVAHGQSLDMVFTSEEEVLNVVEKAILLFREQGISGERFADTVARLGFENVQEQLLSNDLLDRKAQILGLNVVGGATC